MNILRPPDKRQRPVAGASAQFQNSGGGSIVAHEASEAQAQRAPEHWFLDGATYAHDRDWTSARLCAQRALEALWGVS